MSSANLKDGVEWVDQRNRVMNGTSCVSGFSLGWESVAPGKAEYVALLKEYAARVLVQSGLWIVEDSALEKYRDETASMQRSLARMMDEFRQS